MRIASVVIWFIILLIPKSPYADGKTHAKELYLSDVLPLGKNKFVCAITHNYVTKTQKYVALLRSDYLAKNQLNG